MKLLVTVARFDSPLTAEAARLALEQEGVQGFLRDDELANVEDAASLAAGRIELRVADDDAEMARRALRSSTSVEPKTTAQSPDGYLTFPCEDCGKPITFSNRRCGHLEICPHCGGHVDVPSALDASLFASSAGPWDESEQSVDHRKVDKKSASSGPALHLGIAAVLCLAVFPDFFHALRAFGIPSDASFASLQWGLIVRAFQVSVPLLAIIALTPADWQEFGIVRPRWLLDLGGGCLIWGASVVFAIPILVFAMTCEWAAVIAPSPVTFGRPEGWSELLLLIVGSAANGFAEQLAIQGFLLTRLELFLGSSWKAILIATLLFASYHIYQGSLCAIGIAAMGLVYAASFCLIRRLWPLCLAHALADFIAWTAA